MIALLTLKRREKVLFVVCVFVLIFAVYSQKIYRPTIRNLRNLRKQAWDLKNQIANLNFEFADLDYQRQLLSQEKADYQKAEDKLKTQEDKLFSQAELGSLLRKITQSAPAYKLDFISITPKKRDEQGLYIKFPVEIKFSSPYSGLLNYIKELEKISEVLKLQEIKIELDKTVSVNPTALIKLTTVLSERPIVLQKKKIISISSGAQPFAPQDMPVAAPEVKLEGVKLNGVIWEGGEPTAIINNQVVSIGSIIKKKKVIEITQSSVVLQEGETKYTLTFER